VIYVEWRKLLGVCLGLLVSSSALKWYLVSSVWGLGKLFVPSIGCGLLCGGPALHIRL
jgi:hypothetical protein